MQFSVIIPLYNKAPYVAKTIQSVLSQTYTDYELVIVDDGSTDQSAEIAMASIAGHDHCHLIRQEDQGVSMARNHGVDASQGEYLCFLDADDWWEPGFLEGMAGLISSFPEAGIYGTNYTIVNETKHKTRVSPIGVEPGFEKGYINYCQVYAATMAMPLTSSSVAIPRRVFEEMKGFPEGIAMGEDFLLWIHIAMKYKVAFLNQPLACYNQDVDQQHRSVGRLHPTEKHMLWNLTDLEPLEVIDQDYKKLVDALRVNGLMEYYIHEGFHESAKRELAKVDWRLQPKQWKKRYQRPVGWLRLEQRLLRIGSKVKQLLRF